MTPPPDRRRRSSDNPSRGGGRSGGQGAGRGGGRGAGRSARRDDDWRGGAGRSDDRRQGRAGESEGRGRRAGGRDDDRRGQGRARQGEDRPRRGGRDDDRRDDRRDGRGERRGGAPGRGREPSSIERRAPRTWGSLARKGTRWIEEGGEETASGAWRRAMRQAGSDAVARAEGQPNVDEPSEVWIREDVEEEPPRRRSRGADARTRDNTGGREAAERETGRRDAAGRTGRGHDKPEGEPPAKRRRKLPAPVAAELAGKVDPKRRERTEQRLADAIRAYERDRYTDAQRILRPMADTAADVPAVRELYGLTLYRMGKWADAVRELTAARDLGGDFDQYPTLMDCYRALKRWPALEELWAELRAASPSAEVVAEGRIVMAGALADRGQLGEAIELLERSRPVVRNPKEHHLRTMYALADLYDRAGDIPRARELFRRLAEHDPDYFDVLDRLRSL